MSRPAISVENLSKAYRIGLQDEIPDSLLAAASSWARSPFRNLRSLRRLNTFDGNGHDADDTLWALKDVSFEVPEGEVLGVIGRNGAGKSTLLKILSRITEPTSGRAVIRGRVSSLLEVGTGFHDELSGRENVYMNATILGMTKREIDRRFDEIVDFSGVEKFLDTPVKRYSSGMKVRLAFAVAAHLEPEILIIDEVLAVGDAEFQRKCMGKMRDVASTGRTVLFVSHNLTAVRNLCSRALYLRTGAVALDGPTPSVVSSYLYQDMDGSLNESNGMDLRQWKNRYGNGEAQIIHARLLDEDRRPTNVAHRCGQLTVEFTIKNKSRYNLNYSAVCTTEDGDTKVLQLAHQDSPGFDPGAFHGTRTVEVRIDSLPLQCGRYRWILCIHSQSLIPVDVVLDILPFEVREHVETSPRPYESRAENGLCSLIANWQYSSQPSTQSSTFPRSTFNAV